MPAIDIGEAAFLKPDHGPVIVGRDGEFVHVQHAVDSELLVARDQIGPKKSPCCYSGSSLQKIVELPFEAFDMLLIGLSKRGF